MSLSLPSELAHVAISGLPSGASADYDRVSGAVTFAGLPALWKALQSYQLTVQYLTPTAGAVNLRAAISTTSEQGSNQLPDKASLAVGELSYDAPIVITKGGTYSGNWKSTSATTAAVTIATTEPVVIDGANIVSSGGAINAPSGDYRLSVRNVNASAFYTNSEGIGKGYFLNAGNFTEVLVEHCWLENFGGGVRVLDFGDGLSKIGQKLTVRYVEMRNIDGRKSDGVDGYDTSLENSGANAVGLNTLSQAIVEIAWNEMLNEAGKSRTEDAISTYQSGGVAGTPIRIHDNFLLGSYPPDPAVAVGFTGCMIQMGDNPGMTDMGFTEAYDNQVVAIDNCGISISSGHDMHIYNNRVISGPTSPEGVPLNGLYRSGVSIWNYYHHPNWMEPATADPFWYNNDVHDNVVNVLDGNQKPSGNMLVDYDATTTKDNTNPSGHPATVADMLDEYNRWLVKRAMSPEPLGPIK